MYSFYACNLVFKMGNRENLEGRAGDRDCELVGIQNQILHVYNFNIYTQAFQLVIIKEDTCSLDLNKHDW